MSKTTPVEASVAAPRPADVFNMLVELCPLGLMLSSNRKIVACNRRFAAMFGYAMDEMEGRSLVTLYPSEDEYTRIGDRGRQVMVQKGEYQDERLRKTTE